MADDHVLDNDFDAVLRLPSTCRILKTVCAMTGLRFAAIARSTSKGLVICACVDEIGFGLTVGDMIAFGEAPYPGLSNQDLLVAESDGSSPGRDRSGWILAGHRIESYLSVPISCCQRRTKTRPRGGAKPGQRRGDKRHDARACPIAGAWHGALARGANSSDADHVGATAFRARL